jgi:D-alanyl-D-alanine carboxypeptidase (penicillin-binding protein 5/6)
VKSRNILIFGIIGMTFILARPVEVIAEAPLINTNAEAAALIDVSSGRILYSHNGDKSLRIASLTKIMTAIVAIEAGSLSDKVKVSGKAFGVEGSSIYLRLGEEMSLEHMLYGLMLRSGNDAATAIAEHVGRSECLIVTSRIPMVSTLRSIILVRMIWQCSLHMPCKTPSFVIS